MSAQRSRELLGLIVSADQLGAFLGAHEQHDARSTNYDAMCSGLTTREATETCDVCSGTGMRLLSKRRLEEYRRRIAASSKPHEVREHLDQEAHCRDCNGTGNVVVSMRFIAPDTMFNTVTCPSCKGLAKNRSGDRCCFPGCLGGYVIPVTVREKGSSKKGRLPRGAVALGGADDFGSSGLALGDGAARVENGLAELLRTSASMARLRERSGTVADAVAAMFGREGDRWAETKFGRTFAIWPQTSGGRLLAHEAAEASRAGHGFLLAPIERLASVRHDEAVTKVPNVRWRALMRSADDEARRLADDGYRMLQEVS